MVKTIRIERKESAFFFPASDFLAVWNATSSEETRYYLGGVYCETTPAGVILTATDGHVLMTATTDSAAFIGSDACDQGLPDSRGFILKTDVQEKAFKAKTYGAAWIYGDTESGILQVVDYIAGESEMNRVGVCEFERVDGTFPDWRRVMPREDLVNTAPAQFDLDKMTQFQKAAQVYKRAGMFSTPTMRIHPAGGTDPMRIELADVPHFTGVLMPRRW